MLNWPDKDPEDVLDYGIDWAEVIEADDAIASSDWLADPDLVVGESQVAGTVCSVWLSGGTPSTRPYKVTNRITTTAGRTMDRTVRLSVTER